VDDGASDPSDQEIMGTTSRVWRISVKDEAGVYVAAQQAKRLARKLRFNEIGQACLETVALELARNALIHGGGGEVLLRPVRDTGRVGLEIQATDNGPGIGDLEQAMSDGYSTVGGLGTGLGAARRLSDEFEINSQPGGGTCVLARLWRSVADKERADIEASLLTAFPRPPRGG
jgi:serine/threonine-protein kinase RsbT